MQLNLACLVVFLLALVFTAEAGSDEVVALNVSGEDKLNDEQPLSDNGESVDVKLIDEPREPVDTKLIDEPPLNDNDGENLIVTLKQTDESGAGQKLIAEDEKIPLNSKNKKKQKSDEDLASSGEGLDDGLPSNRAIDFEPMMQHEVKYRKLKCTPGLTRIQMQESHSETIDEDTEDDIKIYRRSHMNWKGDATESCKVCVCSSKGTDEKCSTRPARNVNECMRLARIKQEQGSNIPFDHRVDLSRMIRRSGRAQKGLKKPACIPYVSEYSDCSEYTTCRGCTQCRCTEEGQWNCFKKRNTCSEPNDDLEIYEDGTQDNTIGNILKDMAVNGDSEEKNTKRPRHRAPYPEKRKRTTEMPPLGFNHEAVMKELHDLLRGKRSLDQHNETHEPITFHHTVDEINEDTLKNSNISGTLGMNKVAAIFSGKNSRRAGLLINSTTDPLHIEYNHPPIYNNHITDNKIETNHHVENHSIIDPLIKEKIQNIANYTQKIKDKELSKLIVNELTVGSELIGDPKAPITSNVTFKSEKDTLTAMAFIAGNLLNKLWNLEKDDTGDYGQSVSIMSSQKIASLLDLFKEPISQRQELFLKNALAELSEVFDKGNDTNTFVLCETMVGIRDSIDKAKEVKKKENKQDEEKQSTEVVVMSKLNGVLDLIQKYDKVRNNVAALRGDQIPESDITEDEKNSLNTFGTILEKLTNVLVPNKNNHKIRNKIRNRNDLRNSHKLPDEIKELFDINSDKLSAKEKLILDYITQIRSNPCLAPNLQEDKAIRLKESNILLNLSEFLKLKSYSDLLKIVDLETKTSEQPTPTTSLPTLTTTLLPTLTTTLLPTPIVQRRKVPSNNSIKEIKNDTSNVYDNLKIHLKALISDLIEIQNKNGKNIKSAEVNIADALPCILNIINGEKVQLKTTTQYSNKALLGKIKNSLEAIKKESKNIPASRRSNVKDGRRPKSALVWERLIKNLDHGPKSGRRSFNAEPESFENIKKMIHLIDQDRCKTYKMTALQKTIPAAEKLILLKTLAQETSNHANILSKLLLFNNETTLRESQIEELIDFVNVAAANFDLAAKVVRSLQTTQQRKIKKPKETSSSFQTKRSENIILNSNDNFKTARRQTVNEVLKKRISLFKKVKESEGVTNDMAYDMAQRIQTNLESGNDKLAQELYTILMDTEQRDKRVESKSILDSEPKKTLKTIPVNEPRRFEDNVNKWAPEEEDMFLKNLESAWDSIKDQ